MANTLIILWLGLAAVLVVYIRYHKRRECRLMAGLRRTQTYADLHQKISYLVAHYDIDQLRVEQHGVTVTSVFPSHTLLNFDFKQNGRGKRCNAVPRLVVQLLQEDFPQFGDQGVYRMSRYRVYRSNGRKEYGYRFTMRRRQKDIIIYRRNTVQLRIL